jgi:F-type H+-transporting ATPase subunit gamma
MANLKIIRTRIESVTSTRQITSAMKMVSAAKLRKAQDTIINLRPYADKLQHILESLSDILKDDEDFVYARESEVIDKVLIIVITSNRGLCGAFNSNVIKQSILIAHEKYGNQLKKNNVDFFVIGKKGDDYLRKKNFKVVNSRNDLYEKLSFEKVASVSTSIMEQFVNGEYSRIEIVYNQFKNAAVQILTSEQFLPVKVEKKEKIEDEKIALKTFVDYIFEPSKEYIIKELIPRSLKLKFYKALIDSNASEHGARMTAMHKATDNASEMIKQLRLDYNKARQASITNEILEIVSGANALRG